jgi:hypothetical protein
MALYPAATVFCIMITANHYWLDAVGGWVALAIGWLIGSRLAAWTAGRRADRTATDGPSAHSADGPSADGASAHSSSSSTDGSDGVIPAS